MTEYNTPALSNDPRLALAMAKALHAATSAPKIGMGFGGITLGYNIHGVRIGASLSPLTLSQVAGMPPRLPNLAVAAFYVWR